MNFFHLPVSHNSAFSRLKQEPQPPLFDLFSHLASLELSRMVSAEDGTQNERRKDPTQGIKEEGSVDEAPSSLISKFQSTEPKSGTLQITLTKTQNKF